MGTRRLRLASDIRALIGPFLTQCPPPCGVLTITDVKISADDAYVTVAVSALREPALALTWLQESKPELQKIIVKLSTQRVPKLRFTLDTKGEQTARLEQLLQ